MVAVFKVRFCATENYVRHQRKTAFNVPSTKNKHLEIVGLLIEVKVD